MRLKNSFSDEWAKPPINNRFARLYPFRGEDSVLLDASPMVDGVLMKLAQHVTLPIEDTVTFNDVLERRVDQDLRRGNE